MGDSLYKLKRYQEALAAYEQALQLGNSFEQKEAYKGKGNVLQALAEQAFEKAGYEDPFLPDYPVGDDESLNSPWVPSVDRYRCLGKFQGLLGKQSFCENTMIFLRIPQIGIMPNSDLQNAQIVQFLDNLGKIKQD